MLRDTHPRSISDAIYSESISLLFCTLSKVDRQSSRWLALHQTRLGSAPITEVQVLADEEAGSDIQYRLNTSPG